MRHAIKLLTIVVAIVAIRTVDASDRSWYIGFGMGDVKSEYDMADFDDGSITRSRLDNSDSAWKAFAGYFFSCCIGIELGYVDLHNDFDLTRTFTGTSDGRGNRYVSFPDGSVSVDFSNITGPFIAAYAHWPLSQRFGIGTRAGLIRWEAHQTTIDLEPRSTWLNGVDPLAAIVIEFRVGDYFAVRGEAERYFNTGATDHSVVSISLLFRF